MSDEIKSKIFNYGNECEGTWPSQYGTGEKGRMQWCEVQQKCVPIDQVMVQVHANVAHGFIPDEMDAVKHPKDGKYYTSKSKFRAVTKAHGCEEVGTAYENGYEPEKEAERDIKQHSKNVMAELRERMQSGNIKRRY